MNEGLLVCPACQMLFPRQEGDEVMAVVDGVLYPLAEVVPERAVPPGELVDLCARCLVKAMAQAGST